MSLHKIRTEEIYPEIRGFLMETDDPDRAFDFMNMCIMAKAITPGKAKKMFERRFPKETLDDYRKSLVQGSMTDPDLEKMKQAAIQKRIDAIKALGFDVDEFEKQMEEKVTSKE